MKSKEKHMQKFFLGVFTNEAQVLAATRDLRKKKLPIFDVYTPYAVHGLDEAMGIVRSKLPIVTFFAGALGLFLALLLQIWVFTANWPMNIGGKPHNAFPAFIPVAFEITVLFGGLITVAAFFKKCGLFWGNQPNLLHAGITDQAFVMAFEMKDAALDYKLLKNDLLSLGAVEVREVEVSV